MRRALRFLLGAVLLLALVVVGVGAYLVWGGGYRRYDKAALETQGGRSGAPAWTRACSPGAPGVGSASICAAVSGKVLYVQRVDPDGDGDTHFIVLAGTHVHLVKVPLRYRPAHIPGLGRRIVAAGWVTRGASGRAEIDARRLCAPNATSRACAAARAF